MADYHAILKRAIGGLPSPTGEARRAVYEKARNALVTQLRSFDPPLPASEITQQRLQLEDAIRKVESEAAKGLLRQPAAAPAVAPPAPAAPPPPSPATDVAPSEPTPAPAPAAAPPPAPPAEPTAPPPTPLAGGSTGVLKRAVGEAEALGGPAAELGRKTRDTLAETGDAKPPAVPPAAAFGRETPAVPPRKTETEQRRKRRVQTREGDKPPSRLPLFVGIAVAILVIGVGVVALWTQREAISAFFGGAKAPIVDLSQRSTGEKLAPKSTDRLSADDAKSPATPAKPVPTQTITPPSPQLQSATPAQPGSDKPPTQAVPLVAQRAILYEEGKGGGQAQISPGQVVWSVSADPTDPKPNAMILKARVEIPDRGFVAVFQMHPNGDTSFPASHLVEVKFTLPPDFDGKVVTNVPGLIMKATEQARGDPLVGASAKVADNFFWIALGAADKDRERNLKMFKERGWIDVPILYETGRRAILTLEKAGAGDQAVTDAFAAWGEKG